MFVDDFFIFWMDVVGFIGIDGDGEVGIGDGVCGKGLGFVEFGLFVVFGLLMVLYECW